MEEVLKKRPSSTSQEIINGRIIKVLWELKKLGRAEAPTAPPTTTRRI
jgi:hypothetical protein